ncbi:MAG TPA: DUF3300 domain-containing protein [Terriglobia bacterium]|nr:DUF3300 domain-containing protein [Terriglobia bacterium]
MTTSSLGRSIKGAVIIPSLLLLLGAVLLAQEPPYGTPDTSFQQAPPPSSASELTNLVAPIALYPDPLLSQVLVVSTYPQELVEAQQWLEQNGNLDGRQLMYAARQQNWDPSVQALVAFPGVMALLSSNIQWTTALGQAFLAQPSDVMNAIQYLRAQARDRGQLADTPQLSINTESQSGQSAIEIQPANPQMMYVPSYDPSSVWGPPAAGSYPALPYQGGGFGSLFESAINLASLFTGFPGLLGTNGWGWALSWLAHTLFVNNSFLNNFGFRSAGGGSGGLSVWLHNNTRGLGPYARNGGGWGTFGGRTRMFSGGQTGAAFAPQRSSGAGNFPAGGWGTNLGNWRSFRSETRPPVYQAAGRFSQPSWTGNRELQPYNRFAASASRAGSTNYRTPFSGWRSRPANGGGFSTFNNDRARWSRRVVGRSSGFSEPRMKSGHSFWPRHASASWKPPKSEHFRAPHFSAPHFKSHGSSHFSRGHSGGKSRHRR